MWGVVLAMLERSTRQALGGIVGRTIVGTFGLVLKQAAHFAEQSSPLARRGDAGNLDDFRGGATQPAAARAAAMSKPFLRGP